MEKKSGNKTKEREYVFSVEKKKKLLKTVGKVGPGVEKGVKKKVGRQKEREQTSGLAGAGKEGISTESIPKRRRTKREQLIIKMGRTLQSGGNKGVRTGSVQETTYKTGPSRHGCAMSRIGKQRKK